MTVAEEIRIDSESGSKRLEREYKAGLMAFARRFCADESDAEELVYRTFSEVVAGIGSYNEQSAFFGWMCKILVNCHAKETRRKANSTVTFPGDLPESPDDGAARVVQAVDASLLRDAIRALPPEMEEAVVLHYFMDLPLLKIARILMLPVGTVKSRLHYARLILGRRLGTPLKKVGAATLCLLLLLGAALGAVWLGSEIDEDSPSSDNDTSLPFLDDSLGFASRLPGGDASTWDSRLPDGSEPTPSTPHSSLFTLHPPQGDPQVQPTTLKTAAALTTAIALSAAQPAAADGYQYIVSGYPAANERQTDYSDGIALETATCRSTTDASELEARYRTRDVSSGIALNTTEYRAMVIIMR